MARTIDIIQQEIINAAQAKGITISTSRTSRRNMWSHVIATNIQSHEVLFDEHKAEVTGIIDVMKPHSLRWYAQMALKFQFGYELAYEEDCYDNTGLTDEQIAESQIIAYAAVVEQDKGLRIKVAKIVGGDLGPLTEQEKAAFVEYMQRIKDAGVKLTIDSLPPDGFKLDLQVYYNPLVLGPDGARLDGTAADPVGNTIRDYLRNLPFNGTMILAYLTDALQQVDGVVIPHIIQAQAQYGLFPYTAFAVRYNPDAGYLRILVDADLNIDYIPQSVIL